MTIRDIDNEILNAKSLTQSTEVRTYCTMLKAFCYTFVLVAEILAKAISGKE